MSAKFFATLVLVLSTAIGQSAKAEEVFGELNLEGLDEINVTSLQQLSRSSDKTLAKALPRALVYFARNRNQFSNRNFIGLIDYTKHSSEPRLYIVNLKTGSVERHLTSHGKGSDPANTGWARKFSNNPGSAASSVGFFRTGEFYIGKHGRSMRLDGLSSTNSNARNRAVVIHAANYVSEGAHRAGRSFGCPAIDPVKYPKVITKLKGGALIYAWAGQ